MIEFICSYWQYILVVLAIFIEVLFIVLKKRPNLNGIDRINAIIDDALPAVIRLAEESSSSGSIKLAFVVRVILEKISNYFKDFDRDYWTKVIIDKTESILSCPQKKESL